MKPIYEIRVPTYLDKETLESISRSAKEKLQSDYHVIVIASESETIKTRVIPTTGFWGWWCNIWNS